MRSHEQRGEGNGDQPMRGARGAVRWGPLWVASGPGPCGVRRSPKSPWCAPHQTHARATRRRLGDFTVCGGSWTSPSGDFAVWGGAGLHSVGNSPSGGGCTSASGDFAVRDFAAERPDPMRRPFPPRWGRPMGPGWRGGFAVWGRGGLRRLGTSPSVGAGGLRRLGTSPSVGGGLHRLGAPGHANPRNAVST